jgi:Na+/proline symporter/signal transduction histidine kinase
MNSQALLLITLVYGVLMFALAWRADRGSALPRPLQALVFALSLAVYCSSWTFFGAVGRAAENGWDYLPIYLGPVLLFLFGWPLLRRLLVAGARNKVTSIADFIGSRFGKSQSLAALVTVVAVAGSLPYIALQLQAVEMAWNVVSGLPAGAGSGGGTGLVTALLMAWFAILFGTRRAESQTSNRGMVLAIAVESIVKLLAFGLVALLAIEWLHGAPAEASGEVTRRLYLESGIGSGFLTQTLLAAAAIVCLPRQFHLMVVEKHTQRGLRLARWMLPAYLLLFSILVLPVVVAGAQLFAATAVAPDTYVLSLPQALADPAAVAAAFLGGISAATGMILVSTLTVSIMITNEVVVPFWLRLNRRVASPGVAIVRRLPQVRRGAIVVVLLLAWMLQNQLDNLAGLASLGLIAFAAAAQLAPALLAAMLWRRAHRYGVMAGIAAGMLTWFYTLLLPALLPPDAALLRDGPWGLGWLAPENLFGTGFLDPLTHATLWSLGLNLAALRLVSPLCRFSASDVRQARAFMQLRGDLPYRSRDFGPTTIRVRELDSLLEPLLGATRCQNLWRDFEKRLGHRLLPDDRAPRFVVQDVESVLAGIIGASSAERAIELARRERPLELTDLVSIVDGTSQHLQFSHELLETTVETISQGVSVVDADLRLVAWNQRYQELFDYPPRLLYVGCPIRRIYEHNAARGLLGADSEDIDREIGLRLERLRSGSPFRVERALPNGVVLVMEGAPLASGGYVTTFTDISDYKRLVDELEQAKAALEDRVAERTADLQRVNESLRRENAQRARVERELAEAHRDKSRFMAATSHDLLQPINAARLFTASLQARFDGQATAELDHLDRALGRAEQLISSLREIARLDSGRVSPRRETFACADMLQRLHNEFSIIAGQKALRLELFTTRRWITSDPHLLERILQNLLSNAIRYTRRGGVLLGCRYRRDAVVIEVWDSGPGIAEQDRERIFVEFERAARAGAEEPGLGLGLSIAARTARVLGHDLEVRSWPGRGSVFRLSVPAGQPQAEPRALPRRTTDPQLADRDVLCLDNEASVLAGMSALLQQWGCRVRTAQNLAQALEGDGAPDLLLVDYHLDAGETGVAAVAALARHWGCRPPAILVSADDGETVRELARAEGMGFLAKPVAPQALRTLMRRQLRRQRPALAQEA